MFRFTSIADLSSPVGSDKLLRGKDKRSPTESQHQFNFCFISCLYIFGWREGTDGQRMQPTFEFFFQKGIDAPLPVNP